jgi:multidrug efflux pump subunit AcrA (membrane-fusion protein)
MPLLSTEKWPRLSRMFGMVLAGLVAVVSLAIAAAIQEPKRAESSPAPVKAAIVPQIADAKSEAEIHLRGKSFSILTRNVPLPFTGIIKSIDVKEGQLVEEGSVLASYKLEREPMNNVHQILYGAEVVNLKKILYDLEMEQKKCKEVSIPLQKIKVQKSERFLSDTRDLHARGLASEEAVKDRERELETAQKELDAHNNSEKIAEESIRKTREDLRFAQNKQKRDVDLLEWQAKRSYSDSQIPLETAFLKAPISGQVIYKNPEFKIDGLLGGGVHAFTVAPPDPTIIKCKVHELDLVKLRIGDRGTVTFDAVPDKKYPCKISRIPWVSRNPALEVPADYEVECLVEHGESKMRDGLTCNVKVNIKN